MSYKTVRVSYDNWLELMGLKAELGLRDFDEVIGFYVLLQNFLKVKTSIPYFSHVGSNRLSPYRQAIPILRLPSQG